MIIPIRCFTCHNVLADKWEWFRKRRDDHEQSVRNRKRTQEDLVVHDDYDIFFSDNFQGKLLDELGLHKMCCRRHMLGHVDLVDVI